MSTEATVQHLDEAVQSVQARCKSKPRVGLILGSGLGAFADEKLSDATRIPYGEIPHMLAPKVSGHAGNLCLGSVHGVNVACLQGRVHMYEGHPISDVVFGARLLARLGCEAVLVTNAAGGVRNNFRPGTLMLLSDHLNLSGRTPLLGPNIDELGPRFPDMTRAYDVGLADLARGTAADLGIALQEGVYAALLGPSYETPAEIRMLRTMGADAVGMSTVVEVIALRHMGVAVGAVSCITNMAAGMTASLLDHSEVKETAAMVRDDFMRLLASWVKAIGAQA
jgi:purine-nucleoside phosphorylase